MVRAAMLFGLETVALRGKQEAELEVAEMRDVERLLWEQLGWIESGKSSSRGQHMLDVLGVKPERAD